VSATISPSAAHPVDAPPDRGVRHPRKRRWTRFILPGFTKLVLAYLMLPIAVIIIYSFNRTPQDFPKVTFRWNGFTTMWYHQLLQVPDLTSSLRNSFVIAITSTLVATLLGTLMALALARYRYRGRRVTEFIMFLNIAAPEIVMGASLLSLLVTLNVNRGMFTIFLAHVMFNIAIVAVTVRARLSGFDMSVEEAAQDLFARPLATFRLVTLPLIWPGILSGALLAFALSIDDFVITQFVAGQVTTFPLWVYASSRIGIPPQVFVMATLIFVGGVVIAVVNIATGRRRARREGVATSDLSVALAAEGNR
jgi:spermidine/putrescine transport system permease protein